MQPRDRKNQRDSFRVFEMLSLTSLCLTTGLACKPRPNTLQLSGHIEVLTTELSFRIPGKVLERPVEEGQRVKIGQLIARLDSQDLEQQVAMRRSEVAALKAQLQILERGSRPEEIESARASLDQALADFRRLEADEARIRDLHAKGILSTRDFEASKAAFSASKANVHRAEQQFLLVQKGPRPEERDAARSRLEQARQALALAETQLSYASLSAPFDGVVLSKNVEPKEYVNPGTSVVTLAHPGQTWLRAFLPESDLGRVRLGQKVSVKTDSHPGKVFEGHLAFISDEAEFTPRFVQTQKERIKLVYRIKIELSNPDMELKAGMPADAEIPLEKK